MSSLALATSYVTYELLTRQEIERRIQDVVSEVAIPVSREAGSSESFRWIEPADLVRRMRPYLVFN